MVHVALFFIAQYIIQYFSIDRQFIHKLTANAFLLHTPRPCYFFCICAHKLLVAAKKLGKLISSALFMPWTATSFFN